MEHLLQTAPLDNFERSWVGINARSLELKCHGFNIKFFPVNRVKAGKGFSLRAGFDMGRRRSLCHGGRRNPVMTQTVPLCRVLRDVVDQW